MVLANRISLMVIAMKGFIRVTFQQAKENLFMLMVMYMKESGPKEKPMVTVYFKLQMARGMKEIG